MSRVRAKYCTPELAHGGFDVVCVMRWYGAVSAKRY